VSPVAPGTKTGVSMQAACRTYRAVTRRRPAAYLGTMAVRVAPASVAAPFVSPPPPCPLRPSCGRSAARRLERSGMRLLLRHCAWCDPLPDQALDELERRGVDATSGICPRCLRDARAALREYRGPTK
jgi:hypothetical protein